MNKKIVATISSKGQVTLPKTIREALRVHMGDFVRFEPTEKGILLTKISLESEGFSEAEWEALEKLASQKGRRYSSAKDFLKDLEQL